MARSDGWGPPHQGAALMHFVVEHQVEREIEPAVRLSVTIPVGLCGGMMSRPSRTSSSRRSARRRLPWGRRSVRATPLG
jgi:hypothetical protein